MSMCRGPIEAVDRQTAELGICSQRCVLKYWFLMLVLLAAGAAGGGLPFAHWGVLDTPTAKVLQHSQIVLGGSFTTYGYETSDSTSESDFALAAYLEGGHTRSGSGYR